MLNTSEVIDLMNAYLKYSHETLEAKQTASNDLRNWLSTDNVKG